jgi:3-hydroxybutyryl-CoA dehydrogenase
VINSATGHPASTPERFDIRTVAVIGAGVAGRSFALACACAGYHVVLEDVMPANLRKAEADFADMSGRAGPGCLSLALTVEDAVREADITFDFVPDELESKLEIFSMIDRMAPPKTILCTPSDALSITDLASCVYRPDRCFAVRGTLVLKDSAVLQPLRLLYPAATESEILGRTKRFLESLCLVVHTETDPDVPVLMKNLVPSGIFLDDSF